MTAISLGAGSVIAQTPASKEAPKPAVQNVQPAAQVKKGDVKLISTPPGQTAPAMVENKKGQAKPAHVTPVHPAHPVQPSPKVGTPEKREQQIQKLKKDRTPDTGTHESKHDGAAGTDKK